MVARAKAGGFDGVFLDDAAASLRWVIVGGASRCAAYPTDTAWQGAVYSFLSNVAPQLRAAGLGVVAKHRGLDDHPRALAVERAAQRAMEESFTNEGPVATRSEREWFPSQLRHAAWSEANGKLASTTRLPGSVPGRGMDLRQCFLSQTARTCSTPPSDTARRCGGPSTGRLPHSARRAVVPRAAKRSLSAELRERGCARRPPHTTGAGACASATSIGAPGSAASRACGCLGRPA